MSRRRRKASPIAVEIATEQLDPAQLDETELDARWLRAGRRLRAIDPARYRRVFALAEALASVHDEQLEDAIRVRLRLELIAGARREVN